MNNLSRGKWKLIISFVKKHKIKVTCSILCGLIANVLTILLAISIGKYFDFLFGSHSHRATLISPLLKYFWNNIHQYFIYMIGLILIRMLFQYIQRVQMMVLGEQFVKELREKLFRKQLEIQTIVYDKFGTGKYLLRHSGDLKSIRNYLIIGLIKFFTDVFMLVFALYLLLLLNKIIFFLILAGSGVTVLLLFFMNKTLQTVSVKRRNTLSGLLTFVNKQLQAIKTIKAFNKKATEVKKYNKRSSKLFDIGVKFQKIYNLIYVIIPTLLYLILIAIFYFIYRLKQQGNTVFDAGTMFEFILLFITILPTFRRVLRVSTKWKLGNISFNKLLRVFELSRSVNSNNLTLFKFKQGKIEFKSVDFSYDINCVLFNNINFTIQPNCINQIKLNNGYGKSTLVKLLAGLYFPGNGTIEYDSQKIENIKLKSLRKKITFISEEFPLLGNTVFEVVSYSRNKEKEIKAKKVLDKFQQNVPTHLKLNLTDKVIENGINLSKSQIKMLQYIRAVLSNKPIIIIDEPLKNLETNVKKNILQWINKNKRRKTIVFICNNWNEHSIPIDNIIELN